MLYIVRDVHGMHHFEFEKCCIVFFGIGLSSLRQFFKRFYLLYFMCLAFHCITQCLAFHCITQCFAHSSSTALSKTMLPTDASRADRGSSSRYTSSSPYKLLASATRALCPPDKEDPPSPTMVSSLNSPLAMSTSSPQVSYCCVISRLVKTPLGKN